MTSGFTDRESAPFPGSVWDAIDGVVQRTIAESGIARRVLRVAGPLGLAARVGIGDDLPVGGDEEPGPAAGEPALRTHVHLPTARSLPLLHQSFRLGIRSVEGFVTRGEPLDTRAIAEAASRVMESEDRLAFHGNPAAEISGAITLAGTHGTITPGDWKDPARAISDLLLGLERLDAAGRHGPYAAALSADRYYDLFRAFPNGLTPLAQVAPLFEGGIVKAHWLQGAALLIARDDAGPRLAIGQDLVASYDGREGIFHRFSLIESVTVLPGDPGSVVAIRYPEEARPRRGEAGNEEERPVH